MTREDLIARKQQPADVPCRNCTACCERDIIALDPQRDDVASYRHHIEAGRPVLDRKPNGQCTYLAPGGCSIHGPAAGHLPPLRLPRALSADAARSAARPHRTEPEHARGLRSGPRPSIFLAG